EAVKGEDLVLYPLGSLLLYADRLYGPPVRKRSVHGNQCSPLEAAGVGAVDDELPHSVHLWYRGHPEHLCNLEAGCECLGVEGCGRLLVILYEARAVVGVIEKPPEILHLFARRPVNLPE